MADYFCWPLWDIGPTGPDNIDPSTLPLTRGLVEDLEAWAARWDAILNQDYPADSAFPSEADQQDFIMAGHELAVRVAQGLKDRYAVYYFSKADATTTRIEPG